MSKPSRRPTREARKEHTQKRREAQRCLRAAQAQAGMVLLRRAIADDPTAGGEPGIESPGVCGYLTGVVSGVETLPHADILHRLLSPLDVTQLEQAHVAVIRRLIRGKKFRRSLDHSVLSDRHRWDAEVE